MVALSADDFGFASQQGVNEKQLLSTVKPSAEATKFLMHAKIHPISIIVLFIWRIETEAGTN